MLPVPASTVLARLRRSRARLLSAVIALITAVTHWHGWLGWALGLFVGVGLILFEFRKWWDYVTRGRTETPPAERKISGSHRFREPGTTRVRLLAVGDHPNLVAVELRLITGLDQTHVGSLMASVPTTLPDPCSLTSAGRAVEVLQAMGATAQVLITSDGR